MKNKSIILKRISFLFIVIIVPIVLLTSLFLFWNNHKLKTKNLQLYSLKAKSYVDTLDSHINQIYNNSVSILYYSQFEKLVYTSQGMNSYEKVQTVKNLREYISSINTSHDMVKSVRVYVWPMKAIYNSDRYEKGSMEDLTLELWQNISQLNGELPSHIVFDNGRILMVLKALGKDPGGIVEVELSQEQLKGEFERQNQFDYAYYLFCFQDGDVVLDNMKDDQLRTVVLSATYKDGIADFRINGERYYAIKTEFDQIDASYYQVIPGRELVASLHMTNVYTIAWLIIMSVCVYIFLWV